MFADTKLVNLFPVPLWVLALGPEDTAVIDQETASALERLRGAGSGTAAEAWQSEGDLEHDPAFARLCGLIREAAANVLGYLGVRNETFLIAGLRASVTQASGKQGQSRRRSANSYLSGCYFVQAPVGGNSIVFHDPRPQNDAVQPQFAEPNPHNSRNAHIEVRPGALILFPAWLAHSPERNSGDGHQVSIDFDIVLADVRPASV